MQCLAYIISFLADHAWSGSHFPVSGEMEGLGWRLRGSVTGLAALGAERAEIGSIVLMLSIDGMSLKRDLASFRSRIKISRPSMPDVLGGEVSKRR
jgi:hypothetical protein